MGRWWIMGALGLWACSDVAPEPSHADQASPSTDSAVEDQDPGPDRVSDAAPGQGTLDQDPAPSPDARAAEDAQASDAAVADAQPDADAPDLAPQDVRPSPDACVPRACADVAPACTPQPDGCGGDLHCPPDCGPLERCEAGACVRAYPDRRVGIFYLVWHTAAADAQRTLAPAQRGTVEAVIRDSARSASSLLQIHGLFDRAAAFHYHAEPEGGFYSLYRPRAGEAALVDPFETRAVAWRHARQLWDAGIDFVFVDLTNLPVDGPFTQQIGLRPLEVLFEEWRALRATGEMTPQIAAWVPVPTVDRFAEPRTVHAVRAIYADPANRDLVLRDPRTGRKVLFATVNGLFNLDEALRAELEAQDDVVLAPMWGNQPAERLAAGELAWQQACRAPGPPAGALTPTTLVDPVNPCLQAGTPASPIGSALSVSASYQLGYASLPFQASGKRDGLTLKQQFATAFAAQPDWLMINAWNEWIAQPQQDGGITDHGPLAWSMGTQPSDGSDRWLWVDMYGLEYVRDLEPTVSEGDRWYDLLRSCVRVYRAGGCADAAGEACCDVQPTRRLVWSLRIAGAGAAAMRTEHLLTTDFNEVQALTGRGWAQVCNPFYGPPALCSAGPPFTGDLPFELFTEPAAGRTPLYRCLAGTHFFSPRADCEGQVSEGLLGYLADEPSSAAARPLSRCLNLDTGHHFHWLEPACPAGNIRHEGLLGFVK